MSGGRQSPEMHHGQLVEGLYEQMWKIFESSEQAMYLYLDDDHKACNARFAALLGYALPEEWASV